MKIGLVGAIDRYNYGDVLFPIIAEAYISEKLCDANLVCYGSKASDLSKFDALTTKSIRDIKNDNIDVIILVGGEILSANWFDTYFYISKNNLTAFTIRLIRKLIGKKNAENLAHKRLGLNQKLPWVIKNSDYSTGKVLYNSVGGVDIQNMPSDKINVLKNGLSDANYISVRDPKTADNLNKLGINGVMIAPDSAFIMSRVFPVEKINGLISSSARAMNIGESEYIVFQIGINYADGKEMAIAQQLALIQQKLNKRIILLPIGLAFAHEDIIPLRKIYKHYLDINSNKLSIELIDRPTIFDTMYIISNAAAFIGTSLHGSITALSYCRPSIAIGDIGKIKYTLGHWSLPEQEIGVQFGDIYDATSRALTIDKNKLKSNSEKNCALVADNFDRMLDCINRKT